MNNMRVCKITKILVVGGIFFPFFFVWAMSSNNYKINADSINEGGGFSQSASYKVSDTLGEAVNGEGSSASYISKAGFQYMINSYLILNLGSTAADLGTLIPGTPVTGQTAVYVTTDAWGGYTLNVSEDHQLRHSDNVTEITDFSGTIATPLLWESPNNTGFGFSVTSGTGVDAKWGSNPNFKYAAFPLISTTVHTKTGYKSAVDETTIGYKADVGSSQKNGAYSCTITYTAVAAL
jgi:hypothetical protein